MLMNNTSSEYGALEQELITYYEWAYKERLYKRHILDTLVPLLDKLIHKKIRNVNDYPPHYFNKHKNPLFCFLIEKKLKFRLNKTEAENVKKINQYLKGKRMT